jgi:Peptidase family M28
MKRYLLLLVAAVSLLAADFAAEGNRWWAHIEFLASDKMEGRNTGSDAYRRAAEYVAAQFERDGLKPAGTSGYMQPVKFETRSLVTESSSLALLHGDNAEPLELGADASLNARAHLAPALDAPLVFAGYGLTIPEAHYDELQGLNLRGKIVVYVNATGPVNADGNVTSHYSSAVERWATLHHAGAVGIIAIQNPRVQNPTASAEGGDSSGRNGRGSGSPRGISVAGGGRGPAQPAVVLADPSLQETEGQLAAITMTRRGADKFFAHSGHTYEEILQLARDNQPLPKFDMDVTLRMKAVMKRDSMEAPNVAGVLPGSDPKLKDEYVIFSAHLDHLGIGRPVNGDSVYNGAMDNASGVASVLEVARLMKETGARPKRSVLFVALTAEEKGELGSRYFAAHPTVPVHQIVADINLDMFLPLFPLKVLEVQGLAESTLGPQIRAAAAEYKVDVQTDREPEQNRFIRSDQYSFIRRGVPSLAFKFGYEFGSPEEKIRQAWVRERYHRPSDDLTQPVDKESAARFDRIIMSLIERVADDPARPRWNNDSFFKRFAQ